MADDQIPRGFTGRRRDMGDPARMPPGQYLTRDFPVLVGRPDPHRLSELTFKIDGAVDAARTWTWAEFVALPEETPTVDIHCVTKWSKLDTAGAASRWTRCSKRSTPRPSMSRPGATAATQIAREQHPDRLPARPRHRVGQHVDIRLTTHDGYKAQRCYSNRLRI